MVEEFVDKISNKFVEMSFVQRTAVVILVQLVFIGLGMLIGYSLGQNIYLGKIETIRSSCVSFGT